MVMVRKWRFKFNEKRSKVMTGDNRMRKKRETEMVAGRDGDYNYLGVWMDAKLKGHVHLEKLLYKWQIEEWDRWEE